MPGMSTYTYHTSIQDGEVRNYVQRNLSEHAQAKAEACLNLLSRVRVEQSICFALHTALELYAIELPTQCDLPDNTFFAVVRNQRQRSTIANIDYRTWNHQFATCTLPNGLVCMHPIDIWFHYAQYLNLVEMVVLGEAIIRRFGYPLNSFRNRLGMFQRIIGKARCKEALALIQTSDSVQETRTRLALLRFGLNRPVTHYAIDSADASTRYTVDMAYPDMKVAIEYDGDHHRRFRSQYVRDQHKRRNLRAMGWTVIEVFADDLRDEASQQAFANNVASALKIPFRGRPQHEFRALADVRLQPGARNGERLRRQQLHEERNRTQHIQ